MVTPVETNTQSSNLETLMLAAQAGDKRAYAQFLTEASTVIRRFLAKRMHGDDIEDVLQETLTSIHKACHTYDGKRPILPWIYAIARFRLTDYLRKHYSQKTNKHIDIEKVQHMLESPVTESHDLPEYIETELKELPEKQQKIIHLMHVEGYTAKEVGSKLGMNESAVKVSAHRAYKKMRVSLRR